MAKAAPTANSTVQLSPTERRNVRMAFWEGAMSTVMGTLVGGAFLTGFALLLGASDTHIGLLAAIPALANLTQLFGSLLIRKVGSRRLLCLVTIGVSRTLWLLILAIPLVLLGEGWTDVRVWLLMAGIGVVSIFASASGVAWLSWLTDMVPDEIRGRFNGRRSMYAGVAGMVAGIAGGKFIDLLGGRTSALGFSLLFAGGVAFGIAALAIMSRIKEPPLELPEEESSLTEELKRPIRDGGFQKYVLFKVAWAFAVGLAGPFFSVYMIRTLKLDFSFIAMLSVVTSLTSILGMRLWGDIHDRIGPKPLLLLCSLFQATVPLLWMLARPDQLLSVWVVHLLAGFMSAGIGLASTGLLIQLSPHEYNTSYFGVHAASVGIASAASPLVGGVVGVMIANTQLTLGPLHLQGLHILFLTSAVLRLLSLTLLNRVESGPALSPGQLLAGLHKIQKLHPAYGVNQIVGLGIGAVENANLGLARGSLALEQVVDRRLRRGMAAVKKTKEMAKEVDSRIDAGLDRHEQRLESLFDKIAERLGSWFGRK